MASLATSEVPMYNFAVAGQGGKIPQVGLGTSNLTGETCEQAVVEAIKSGYRLIDTALLYGNHAEVGAGVLRGIAESNLDRDDVFIISKVGFFPPTAKERELWMYEGGPNIKGSEAEAIELSLSQLKLKYVDMFLIHNPTATIEEYNCASLPHFFELFNLKNKEDAVKPQTLPNGMNAVSTMSISSLTSLSFNLSSNTLPLV